jgi:hypothetical protein
LGEHRICLSVPKQSIRWGGASTVKTGHTRIHTPYHSNARHCCNTVSPGFLHSCSRRSPLSAITTSDRHLHLTLDLQSIVLFYLPADRCRCPDRLVSRTSLRLNSPRSRLTMLNPSTQTISKITACNPRQFNGIPTPTDLQPPKGGLTKEGRPFCLQSPPTSQPALPTCRQ